MIRALVSIGGVFLRQSVGVAVRPYETYRHIVTKGSLWELGFLGGIFALYFATAAWVKSPAPHPFMLTRQFFSLASGAAAMYALAVFLFWTVGTLMGAKGTIRGMLLGWAYSLLPTLLWFWITSMLYIIVPPPRTTSPLGVAFSIVYLLFSATLLFWKVTLSYLALRFGLRLDLVRIMVVCAVVLPILALYSVVLYRFGVFRVPFV